MFLENGHSLPPVECLVDGKRINELRIWRYRSDRVGRIPEYGKSVLGIPHTIDSVGLLAMVCQGGNIA